MVIVVVVLVSEITFTIPTEFLLCITARECVSPSRLLHRSRCRTLLLFITAGPITKLCVCGGGGVIKVDSGGYVLGYDEPRLLWTCLTTTH